MSCVSHVILNFTSVCSVKVEHMTDSVDPALWGALLRASDTVKCDCSACNEPAYNTQVYNGV